MSAACDGTGKPPTKCAECGGIGMIYDESRNHPDCTACDGTGKAKAACAECVLLRRFEKAKRDYAGKAKAAVRIMHLADIRLRNNAGLLFPVCEAGRKLLRLGCGFNVSNVWEDVTCPRCRRMAHRRYPWASFGRKP